MSAISQKNHALSVLDTNLGKLSKLYRECYLSMGKGALLVYATNVIERGLPSKHDYRTKEEIFEVFDAPSSIKIAKMIDDYDQKSEGIMALITAHSNATFFVTVKLK
ncbi:hypothetical protein [uncultured Lamprocystis sp.]|uniref:hypothetical protein n=1 Tax=uncultured Lamprocystis sp. TaxID=543132 RepID=UPI0025D7ADE9|nr:hypothetical protein [uncultured Lamprocystis sp.]